MHAPAESETPRYIATLFRTLTHDSFTFVWFVGGLAALLDIIPALLTTSATARADDLDADEIVDPGELAM